MPDNRLKISNPLRDKMETEELAVGMIVRLVRGVEIVAIAKTAGFDCLFIDLEHNDFSNDAVTQICMSSNLAGITPLVRVGELSALQISKALDCGAMGVIVPDIENAVDAKRAVNAAKYTPLGNRSIMPCLPHLNFQPTPATIAMPAVNDATILIAMIESLSALEYINEIAAVDGIDMLLIGTNDLCNALGLPGQKDHPKVRAEYERVAKACKANDIHFGVGGLGESPELAKEIIGLGASYVTAGADVTFFTKAAIENAKKFK